MFSPYHSLTDDLECVISLRAAFMIQQRLLILRVVVFICRMTQTQVQPLYTQNIWVLSGLLSNITKYIFLTTVLKYILRYLYLTLLSNTHASIG